MPKKLLGQGRCSEGWKEGFLLASFLICHRYKIKISPELRWTIWGSAEQFSTQEENDIFLSLDFWGRVKEHQKAMCQVC